MKCAVCEISRPPHEVKKSIGKFGTTGIHLCREHKKGMELTGGSSNGNDMGYFSQGTGGGRRVIRSGDSLS